MWYNNNRGLVFWLSYPVEGRASTITKNTLSEPMMIVGMIPAMGPTITVAIISDKHCPKEEESTQTY